MQTAPGFALRKVRESFKQLSEQMRRMNPNFELKPNDVNVIKSVDGGVIQVCCDPVVCKVPERASHSVANLYVVFAGTITFNDETDGKQLLTESYSTNFGYFDVQDGKAKHVLGGHYDFSNLPAHPRAHLQLCSQAHLYEPAQEQFHSISQVAISDDAMTNVLTGARAPTAQMDFLSFMLQICADHLVDGKSPGTVVSQFDTLALKCDPLMGFHAGVNVGCDCHRSHHWYP